MLLSKLILLYGAETPEFSHFWDPTDLLLYWLSKLQPCELNITQQWLTPAFKPTGCLHYSRRYYDVVFHIKVKFPWESEDRALVFWDERHGQSHVDLHLHWDRRQLPTCFPLSLMCVFVTYLGICCWKDWWVPVAVLCMSDAKGSRIPGYNCCLYRDQGGKPQSQPAPQPSTCEKLL